MKQIKKIVIVGGGTAGWITALNLLQKTFCDIVVVSSKEIPIIGVGESTTGKLAELVNIEGSMTNIDEKELIKKTGSTFKLGNSATSGLDSLLYINLYILLLAFNSVLPPK